MDVEKVNFGAVFTVLQVLLAEEGPLQTGADVMASIPVASGASSGVKGVADMIEDGRMLAAIQKLKHLVPILETKILPDKVKAKALADALRSLA